MLKRLSALVVMIALCCFTLVGCGSKESQTIKIGVPIPLTGAQANFGEILQKAYRMAEEEINNAGGVKGKKLELVIVDHQGKPEAAMASAENMITTDKVSMLLGGYASSTAYAIAQVAQKNSMPYVVDVASADRVTQQGWKCVFRFSECSSMAMDGPISFMEKIAKPESIALIYENSVFGQDSIKIVESWAKQNGVKVAFSDSFMPGSVDFKPILSRIKEAHPDIIIPVAYLTDAVLIVRQAKELDISPKMFIGAGAGFVLPEFVTQAGNASAYVASASIWQPDMKYAGIPEFVKKWTDKFGTAPTYHAAAGYAAIYVAKDALERAVSLKPEDIANALKATDLKTVYGRVKFEDFNGYTNQNKPMGVMVQWLDGKLPTVWPAEAAAAKYVYPVPAWNERK